MPDYLEAAQNGFSDTNEYPIDSRGLIFTFAFFTRKHLGEGQFYLMTVKDKEGDNFDGGKTYRLTVPANAPVNEGGSVTVQFGGCDGQIPNCLPTMPGWNYMVRLYRPRAEILNGTWKFPEAEPVN